LVLRPQIITQENILTSYIAPAGDRIAAMVGSAIWGDVNTVTTVSSLNDFISKFGDDKTGTGVTLIKGADLFFRNGGTLKVVRIVDGDEVKATEMFTNGATDVLSFTGKYYGTYGNNIEITISVNGSARDIKITDGKIIEIFNNSGTGYTTNEDIETAINAGSSLVTVAVETGHETSDLVDVATATYLTTGDDGEDSLDDADYTDAFDDLLTAVDYNFLLMPGKTDNAFHATIVGKLDTRTTTEKKYSRFVTGIAVDESISTAIARTASGKRLTVVAPNVNYTHRVDSTSSVLDGSYLACAYTGKICQLDLQISGTHETVSVEGLSVNVATGQEYYSKTEQEQLLQGHIAPISIIGTTRQMVRGITRYSDATNVFFEEVIVDILDYVREQSEEYLNTVIGKPNTTERRSIYSARLDAILVTAKHEEIIQDYQPSVVEEGSSNDTILATISIKPAYSTNFVQLTININ